MIPILFGVAAIGTIIVAWKALRPAASQASGVPAPVADYSSNPGFNTNPANRNPAPTAVLGDSGLVLAGAGLSMASTGLGVASSIGSASGAAWAAGSAIPIAGAAVAVAGVIFGVMMQAHAKRLKQATDENSAVNMGVKGFDTDLQAIASAVNARQITVAQALPLLAQVKTNYWAEVVPHIQPGRNGCQGGAGCPGGQTGGKGCVTGQCK